MKEREDLVKRVSELTEKEVSLNARVEDLEKKYEQAKEDSESE